MRVAKGVRSGSSRQRSLASWRTSPRSSVHEIKDAGSPTEAVMAVCDWLAERTVLRIDAHIHPCHEASKAVAQRIGMVRTGECDDEDEEIWSADYDVTAHRS